MSTQVKEIGVGFAGDMVRAIFAGRKTRTRRLVKLRGRQELDNGCVFSGRDPFWMVWPYGQPGDRIWARESFHPCKGVGLPSGIKDAEYVCFRDGVQKYRRGGLIAQWTNTSPPTWGPEYKFRPSIHMPRWACRLLLGVTEVSIERIQDITDAEAIEEGVEPNWAGDDLTGWNPKEYGWLPYCTHYPNGCDCAPAFSPRESFRGLWTRIYGQGEYGWDANPHVWNIAFRVIPKEP